MIEVMDLSIPTLMRACKGNVKNLPSFMVHNNEVWPRGEVVKLDTKNRIHVRRATFLNVVCKQIPVRPGIWHRIDVQEFHIDLQPHHLQGSQDMQAAADHTHSREIVKADQAGRTAGDQDYGDPIPEPNRNADIAADVEEAEKAGTRRSVQSTAVGGVDDS